MCLFIRSQGTCWTFSDLMKKSQLICEGQPARYRLLTTKSNLDKKGKVRKLTFGQPNTKTQNKIILMVGQTGTGKSTLINTMVNYLLRVKDTDDVWFEITEDEGGNQIEPETADQTKSQTNEITVYEVFVQGSPISVTVIDTPGYGDTKGPEFDQKIAKKLWKLFKSDTGVKEIDAVCLVVKASENRLSDKERYIFDAILSLFGKDIEENIVAFVTHSDGGPPTNLLNAIQKAKIPCKKDPGNKPVHFLFNNRQAEQRDTAGHGLYQYAWGLTEKSLKNFFTSLKEQNKKSLENTERVLTENIRLKACVSNLQTRIQFKELKCMKLTQIQEALKENEEKIKRKENFTFTVTKIHKERVTIENASWCGRKVTSCSVCQENCHWKSCWCALRPSLCEVIKNEHCTVCPKKCHYSKHVRENKKYITKTEDISMTYTDLIKEYENPETSAQVTGSLTSEDVKMYHEMNKKQKENMSLENRLKEELTEIEIEKTALVEEACTTIVDLSKIALKPDSAFIIESLDFLIPRAEEAGDREWVLKLKELRETEPEALVQAESALRHLKFGLEKMTSLLPSK